MDAEKEAKLAQYRKEYPAKPPQKECLPAECILLDETDGVFLILSGNFPDVMVGSPPTTDPERLSNKTRYLWVLTPTATPSVLENVNSTKGVVVAKHSNLTGGEPAHCGGEVWFAMANKIFLSGSSGRYGPATQAQWVTTVELFRKLGFLVADLGWDEGTNRPFAILKGDPEWQ